MKNLKNNNKTTKKQTHIAINTALKALGSKITKQLKMK